jgi:hypothetical protein
MNTRQQTPQYSPEEARLQIESWRNDLQKWLDWLESESEALTARKPEAIRTLATLRQNLSLVRPWMQGLALAMPKTEPSAEDFPVQRCEFKKPNITMWPQYFSRGQGMKYGKEE